MMLRLYVICVVLIIVYTLCIYVFLDCDCGYSGMTECDWFSMHIAQFIVYTMDLTNDKRDSKADYRVPPPYSQFKVIYLYREIYHQELRCDTLTEREKEIETQIIVKCTLLRPALVSLHISIFHIKSNNMIMKIK